VHTSMSTWIPRALKKRTSEFNVGDGARGAGAPALPAAMQPPTPAPQAVARADPSSFKGASDLDDLDEAEPSAKRARAAEYGPGTDRASGVSDPTGAAAPFAGGAAARDEIVDAAPKLAAHITSAGKFNKVAAMCFTLLEGGKVTTANAGAFLTVLQAAMLDERRLRDKVYRVAYRKLYSAALARSSVFPASAQPILTRWRLQVLTQIDLHTDDSYQFARAAKEVREKLLGLPCIYAALEPAGVTHLPEAERPAWAATLFECVDAAMAHHKFAWARTDCDMLVKAAVDRRQNFSDEQQATIQEWNARCKWNKVVRQQEHAAARAREQTSFERSEQQWRSADIASGGGGGESSGGGLDGWVGKQANN
jgi:uncharacterized membrane protein YgcG